MVGPSTTLQAWYTLVVPSTEAGPESTDRTNPDQTRDKSCSLESWWKKMKLDRRQNLPMLSDYFHYRPSSQAPFIVTKVFPLGGRARPEQQ